MVHTYKMNGYNIAVDGNSGTIHLLDDLSYAILSENCKAQSVEELKDLCKNKYSSEEANEVFQELGKLEKDELLFSDDSYLYLLPENCNKTVKSICLHVAQREYPPVAAQETDKYETETVSGITEIINTICN